MKDKKVFLLFIVGVLFVLVGVFAGRSSNESIIKKSEPISEITQLPVSNPSILGRKESSEVLITKVLDGDTVETSLGEKIRYIGINAPENGEPFSNEATKLNQNMVLGKGVRLELDVQAKDRYGRTLAYVFVGNTFVNLEIVKKGLAVVETIQPNVKYQDKIVKAQKEARENHLGLWHVSSNNCIKIVSINADAKGNDNQNKNGEWAEISSSCSKSISMDGWSLKDSSASNKYQFKNFSLDTGKSVTLYSGCGQDSEDKLYWKCPEEKYAIWNNAGDHAFLYNEKGELVSDYQY